MTGVCAVGDDTSLCERLPLALEITATILSTHLDLDLDELTGELGAASSPQEAPGPDESVRLGESSVRAAIELAYRGLPATAARVFRLLPVNPGPDVSTASIATLANLAGSEIDEVLVTLTRACLAEPTSGSGGRWRMNDLVRRYAQDLSETPAEANGLEKGRDRLLNYYLNMAAAADDHLTAVPGAPPPGKFTGQDEALAWLDAERKNLIAAVRMAADTGRDQAAVSLPLLLAHYFAHRHLFADLLTTTLVSLSTARRLGDQDAEGDALINLGNALLETHQYEEAAAAHREAAVIFEETGDRRGQGDALDNLGLDLTAMGRPDEAVATHQSAAAIFREMDDRRGENKALNHVREALRKTGR